MNRVIERLRSSLPASLLTRVGGQLRANGNGREAPEAVSAAGPTRDRGRLKLASELAQGEEVSLGTAIVRRPDDVGTNLEVISDEGGPYALHDEDRAHVVVLRETTGKQDSIDVLYAFDADPVQVSGHVELLSLLYRARGVLVTKRPAGRDVIQNLYERHREERMLRQHPDADSSSALQADFQKLVEQAAEAEASDIHILLRPRTCPVLFRVHGDLMEHTRWSRAYAVQFANTLYNTLTEGSEAQLNETKPQNARVEQVLTRHGRFRLRLQTVPDSSSGTGGLDIILRMLPVGRQTEIRALGSLGYNQHQQRLIRRGTRRAIGGIVLAGPTGSGKSTTLVNLIRMRHRDTGGRKKIYTIEDPVEYEIPGATQYGVQRGNVTSSKSGEDDAFNEGIQAAVRADPDIVFIGEIRDTESANLFLKAVTSGHQVFATTHTPDAISIVRRLHTYGIAEDYLTDPQFLAMLGCQRLVQRLCGGCAKRLTDLSPEDFGGGQEELEALLWRIEKALGGDVDAVRVRGDGCSVCRSSWLHGVVSREVCAEVIIPNEHTYELLKPSTLEQARRVWREQGGRTMMDHGLEKVRAGHVDPRDLEHALTELYQEVAQ